MTVTDNDLPILADGDPQPVVAEIDGIPISGLLARARNPRAAVVALHGGATTSLYFDCPGHPELSLLRTAAAAGFTVLALDRPGYGRSHPYAATLADPRLRVELMYRAIDHHLDAASRGAGIFLMAHSAGCETAVRMAADAERGPQLLGMELSGTGRQRQPAAEEILAVRPRPDNVKVGRLLWEPARLYPPEHVGGGLIGAGGPGFEGRLVQEWATTHFPELGPRVRIPVRFTVADHEKVWRNDPAGMLEVAELFPAAARLVLNIQRNSGHNISIGHTATAYHLELLAFAAECVVARETGEFSSPAIQFDGMPAERS